MLLKPSLFHVHFGSDLHRAKACWNYWYLNRMELAAKQDAETDEQELVMQLSPLYLEQLEAARLDGERQGV
jgi:hypothetical protein